MTSVPRIAVVNYSTLLTDAQVRAWVPALQRQVTRDFAPIWGVDAIVVFLSASGLQSFHWVLGVFDNADQAGALGYHDLTASGKPLMKIFVADTQKAGGSVSSVASHELLETLADAFIESIVLKDNGNGTGTLYALEVGDPVQADSYQIWGVELSNFVTPFWFGDPLPAGGRYDFLGKLSAPFSMTPGGYFSSAQITNKGLQPWRQTFGNQRPKAA